MAPRPDLQASGVDFLADLHLTLDHGSTKASAHLTGGFDDLVLEVDHPLAMLRAAPRRSWPEGFFASSLGHLAGASARVTSRGTTLGRVGISSSGRPQFRPSLAALALPAKSVTGSRNARIIGSAVVAIVVTAIAAARFRRS